jgi:hypothetical protein
MTLIVGILCKESVVLASDSAATFASGAIPTIGQQEMRKLRRLNENLLYSSTGAVGISQLVSQKLKSLWENKAFSGLTAAEAVMDKIGKEIVNLIGPYLQTANLQRSLTGDASSSLCKSIVALPVQNKPCLFSFDFNGAPEQSTPDLPFISLGSGQPIADPFLALLRRLLWSGREPSLAEGRLAAVWTIEHVRRTNPGGVAGDIQLAALVATASGKLPIVTEHSSEDVQEHLQRIASAEQVLVEEIRGSKTTQPSAPLPTPPSTETQKK